MDQVGRGRSGPIWQPWSLTDIPDERSGASPGPREHRGAFPCNRSSCFPADRCTVGRLTCVHTYTGVKTLEDHGLVLCKKTAVFVLFLWRNEAGGWWRRGCAGLWPKHHRIFQPGFDAPWDFNCIAAFLIGHLQRKKWMVGENHAACLRTTRTQQSTAAAAAAAMTGRAGRLCTAGWIRSKLIVVASADLPMWAVIIVRGA